MSSYERDAVEGYDDLATDITNFLNDTDGDYYKTLCYLQELRRDCLNKHIEYDVGLLGGHDTDHDDTREELLNTELAEWFARSSDDFHWLKHQFDRDVMSSINWNDVFAALTTSNNVRLQSWLHQLDFYGSQSGVTKDRVFYLVDASDVSQLRQMLELDDDSKLTSSDGPDVYFASDYASPIGVTLHIVLD